MKQALVRISVAAMFALPATVAAQECLHGSNETPVQKTRRQDALRATRQINTLQANRPGARQRKYLDQEEMAVWYADLVTTKPATNPLIFDPAAEVIPGWQLTLEKTKQGYWFIIKDKTDPCGFAFVSNQEGIIYSAEPIR